jgi:sec-independent protein translocase protein TatB
MGSLSLGEIVTIMVIVLIIFGPDRLPELARRIGSMVAKAREATASFTRQIEAEYGEAAEPIKELRTQIEGARRDLTDVVTGIADVGKPEPAPASPPSQTLEDAGTVGDVGDPGDPSDTAAAPGEADEVP